MSVTYDARGEPRFLGFAVEPYYGEEWVARLALREGISQVEAAAILERGGKGGPLPLPEASRRCGM